MSSTTSYIPANTVPDTDPRFENLQDDVIYGNQYGETTNQQQPRATKKFRLKLSQRLYWTAVLAFISYLILLTSFASPYWLSSYKFTDSTFKRLGLWDFCFQDYRHPSYQYDMKFSGCHWIYSPVYANIRDWLQPTWFVFVQAVMTIALCVSTIGLLLVSIIFMHFLIRYQLIILCLALVCHLFTALLTFFALSTFYFKAFDKSWIMYPDYNHVDWSFFFALVSLGGNGFASYLYYQEARTLKERMLKMKRLIVATSNGRPMSGGGDLDSLENVYGATRSSVNMYNQTIGQQQSANDNNNQDNLQAAARNKEANLVYPHFTQV